MRQKAEKARDYELEFALADARARSTLRLYTHGLLYLVCGLVFAATDLLTSPGLLWFQWPLMGWGAALAGHGALARRRIQKGVRSARTRDKDGG
jgi:hypothetical protein